MDQLEGLGSLQKNADVRVDWFYAPQEMTITMMVEIILIGVILSLIESEEFKKDRSPFRNNLRVLLWFNYVAMASAFVVHLFDKKNMFYVFTRINKIIIVFLNLTVCYGLSSSLQIVTKITVHHLFFFCLISIAIDFAIGEKSEFCYLVNLVVSIYSLYLIGKWKEMVKGINAQSFVTITALQRIEFACLILQAIVLAFVLTSDVRIFPLIGCISIIYVLKMYLLIITLRDDNNNNNRKKEDINTDINKENVMSVAVTGNHMQNNNV